MYLRAFHCACQEFTACLHLQTIANNLVNTLCFILLMLIIIHAFTLVNPFFHFFSLSRHFFWRDRLQTRMSIGVVRDSFFFRMPNFSCNTPSQAAAVVYANPKPSRCVTSQPLDA